MGHELVQARDQPCDLLEVGLPDLTYRADLVGINIENCVLILQFNELGFLAHEQSRRLKQGVSHLKLRS